ncbi:MAG: ABC transporter ATP-binding protein [Rhizobiaceae bacterium]|nr:ABC transporter ATP-binding protein [Rhizobiaceae bacterium]
MTLLNVQNLNLSIGKTPILKDISFDLEAGRILGIVGESGSGKSITALSVLQLLPNGTKWDGEIKFDGEDIKTLSEDDFCHLRGNDISMIFQEPMTALNPVQTIGDQVSESIRIHTGKSRREAEQLARETLNRVELPESEFPLSRYPHDLSGGQRQRVMIAMAIALQPKLLIADEPTTALDVTTQAEILELLEKLVREDGLSLMLITHDLAVVAQMADDVVVMKDGEIVEQGASIDVFSKMQHPYTRQLFSASNHVPDRAPHQQDDNDIVLSVEHVSCDYKLPKTHLFSKQRYFRAVDNVSFKIHRGENVGLVGGSGCGKSTLSRAILALKSLDEGHVLINGKTFSSSGKGPDLSQRAATQIVFQDPYSSFNPRHKVKRLITEPFYTKTEELTDAQIDAAVTEALESVGLKAEDGDKYIHEFSGGQRQRIAIARALIVKPSLIVLDEAVSALDVSIRAQVLDLLAELSDRFNLSYLFISHDLSVVRSITDRVLVMERGKIVETGSTQDVFENPQHAYTQSLIRAIPKLDIEEIRAKEKMT